MTEVITRGCPECGGMHLTCRNIAGDIPYEALPRILFHARFVERMACADMVEHAYDLGISMDPDRIAAAIRARS